MKNAVVFGVAALLCIAAADALEAAGDNSQISRKTTEDIAKMANDMESEYTCKKPIRLFSTCDFASTVSWPLSVKKTSSNTGACASLETEPLGDPGLLTLFKCSEEDTLKETKSCEVVG